MSTHLVSQTHSIGRKSARQHCAIPPKTLHLLVQVIAYLVFKALCRDCRQRSPTPVTHQEDSRDSSMFSPCTWQSLRRRLLHLNSDRMPSTNGTEICFRVECRRRGEHIRWAIISLCSFDPPIGAVLTESRGANALKNHRCELIFLACC